METVSKSFLASTVIFADTQRKAHVDAWAEFERQQMNARIIASTNLTMSSREIAELVNSRHDSVKRTVDRLVESEVISQPPSVDGDKSANGVVEKLYRLCKRDSLIVVAPRGLVALNSKAYSPVDLNTNTD